MICVSIAQESRTLALVDILNAASQCDLIEVRMDAFENDPDPKTLVQTSPKPLILSCRREREGGSWQGTEEARLALLRLAVLEKPAYVELEHDIAHQIRRFGPTKRIIAYNAMDESPDDLDAIYDAMCGMDPDVIKLVAPARTPEEAWPLIKLVAKGKTPTVAVGLGRNGRMLNILGRRYKAPWTYVALERGMEAYPGIATIGELDDYYDFRNVGSDTPLLGITGFSDEQLALAKVLNHGFRLAGSKTHCMPMDIGSVKLFKKIVTAIRLAGVLVDDANRETILEAVTDPEESVQHARAADFVAIRNDKWLGFNALSRAVVQQIETRWREHHPDEPCFEKRTFAIVSASATARGIALMLRRRGATIVIADRDNERARKVASDVGARYVAATQIFSTVCDAMILCRNDLKPEPGKAAVPIPRNVARPGMIGVDLTHFPFMTPFLDEIRLVGGVVVKPIDVFLQMLQIVLQAYTQKSFRPEQLREALADTPFDFDSIPGVDE